MNQEEYFRQIYILILVTMNIYHYHKYHKHNHPPLQPTHTHICTHVHIYICVHVRVHTHTHKQSFHTPTSKVFTWLKRNSWVSCVSIGSVTLNPISPNILSNPTFKTHRDCY